MATEPDSHLIDQSDHGVERLLGELELAIMRIVWARDTVTVLIMLKQVFRMPYAL